jgi:WD40 repeat protein
MSVAFIDGDARIMAGGWDGVVRAWDLRTPAQSPQIVFQHDAPGSLPSAVATAITSVAFSQDGLTMVANFPDGRAGLIDLRNPAAPPLLVPGRQGGISAVARSPDGHTFAVGRGDKTVQVWDSRNPDGDTRLVLRGHDSLTIALAFSADGQTLISSSTTETLWSWIGPTETLAEEVCKKVWRSNFTPDEWTTLVGQGVPHERTCPER